MPLRSLSTSHCIGDDSNAEVSVRGPFDWVAEHRPGELRFFTEDPVQLTRGGRGVVAALHERRRRLCAGVLRVLLHSLLRGVLGQRAAVLVLSNRLEAPGKKISVTP